MVWIIFYCEVLSIIVNEIGAQQPQKFLFLIQRVHHSKMFKPIAYYILVIL